MGLVSNLVLYLVVVGAGISVAVQQVLNANLRSAIGSPWWAGFVSYAVGTLAMLTLALMAKGPRLTEVLSVRAAPMSWMGGLFGAIFVGTAILMIPRLGTATVLALIVVGQMTAGIAIDHFGLFGTPQQFVNPARLAGAALLVAGVVLIRR